MSKMADSVRIFSNELFEVIKARIVKVVGNNTQNIVKQFSTLLEKKYN